MGIIMGIRCKNHYMMLLGKGLSTPSESWSGSAKDQRTGKVKFTTNNKKSLSLRVNGP